MHFGDARTRPRGRVLFFASILGKSLNILPVCESIRFLSFIKSGFDNDFRVIPTAV